jgi:ATP-binding cassette subfamily C protein
MRLFITFVRNYPLRSTITLVALLFAGLAEGFGIVVLLPLLNLVLKPEAALRLGGSAGASNVLITIEQMVRSMLGKMDLAHSVAVLLVFFVATIVLKCLLVLYANRHVGYTVAHIATDLRLKLLRALFVTRWEYFIRQPIGRLTNAVATEANRSSAAFLSGAKIAALVIEGIVYIVLALLVSWKVTLASIGVGFIILFVLRRLVQKTRRAGKHQTKLLQSLLANMTDILQSIKPLKAMAREDSADSVLRKKTRRLNRTLQKQVYSKEALKASQEPLLTGFLALGLYLALIYWKLPLATLLVTIYLVGRVVKQMQKVQTEYQNMVVSDSAYWSIISKIKEAQEAREETFGGQPPSLVNSIRLDQVSFAYDKRWVLKNVTMKFPAGLFTAVVGPSGAGKTTVADLVIGLLQPQKGEVWIDDLPLAQADVRNWRRMIGYVPQETLLLHDTVLINVTLGDEDLTDTDVESALRAAGAWEFVSDLPQGVHSIVGERGYRLSGGQRQRIAIARALVHRPKLLILDEATTALDPENEAAICATLRKLSGEITVLAISHQTAVLEAADQAYRLQDGGVVQVADVKSSAGLGIEKIEPSCDRELQMEPVEQNWDK